jgi:putative membrane protein
MSTTTSLEGSTHKPNGRLGVKETGGSTTAGSTRGPSPSPSWKNHSRQASGNMNLDSLAKDYFVGPRNMERHSKLPYFLRMSGSITPRMIVPILFVAAWATCICLISHYVYPLVVDTVLLTVLGIVIGLAISFRTSSAYERWIEGRRYWSLCNQASRDLARHIWIHVKERHDQDAELGKKDLLAKITALNLIEAFSVALKHKLQFQPYANYEDLEPLIGHLHTFAHDAYDPVIAEPKPEGTLKKIGVFLGITFAESNPRKLVKKSKKNLGNLPYEILCYLSAYIESVIDNETFNAGPIQSIAMANLAQLNDVMTGTERVLNTPLPLAYSIAISQVTWIYVLALPFQLFKTLHFVSIPGTIIGAYIILGIAAIGKEIENPFGNDTNDLPMDDFCKQIKAEIALVMSKPKFTPEDFILKDENKPILSLSHNAWQQKSVADIRASLHSKAHPTMQRDDVAAPEKQIGMV